MFNLYEEDYFSEYDRNIDLFPDPFEDIIELAPSYSIRRENTEREIISLKEIKSDNSNFMQEKNIKYNLYPLFINWKKIETKEINNNNYNIFKLFGYFGAAIYNILKEEEKNSENKYKHKNFIFDISSTYLKLYDKSSIEGNDFYKKLINIYGDVISLIKNKIIMFKEISVFLTIMRLYENYFVITNDNDKLFEVLKYQYMIISYITENEYERIFNNFYRRYNSDFFFSRSSRYKYPDDKPSFIKYIKDIYKSIKKYIKK